MLFGWGVWPGINEEMMGYVKETVEKFMDIVIKNPKS